jgi:hypothetical protein
MFCKNCGIKIEENSKFCVNCGESIVNKMEKSQNEVFTPEKVLFYGQDWERVDSFTVSVLPPFDILITEDFLYLIPLPVSLIHDVGNITSRPFFGLGLLGGLVSSAINSSKNKTIDKNRLSWIDSNQQLVSLEYQNMAFLKIPRNDIKNSIQFLKNLRGKPIMSEYIDKITFTYNNKKIKLQSVRTERDRLKNFLESYF